MEDVEGQEYDMRKDNIDAIWEAKDGRPERLEWILDDVAEE